MANSENHFKEKVYKHQQQGVNNVSDDQQRQLTLQVNAE